MIDLTDKIENSEDKQQQTLEQKETIDLLRSRVLRQIEDTVTLISKTSKQLSNFAYELRRLDLSNKYSRELLSGNVKPAGLVDIILANSWDE